jgi:3alpha(or 20beta)-hydroxysteroid dehydrogenase
MVDRLAGKVALVTGGAGGMGEAHARAIVAEGGEVVIADLDDARGQEIAAELGSRALYVHLDVTSTTGWADAVVAATERFEKLNVLVNNAGILAFSPIAEYTDEDWDLVIAVNLTGAFKGIRAALPSLIDAAPSSIINVSSTAGLKGFANVAGYNASKYGLRGLTKSVAVEMADNGVRVNSVHPGNIETKMIEGFFKGFPHVPMKRAGRSTEVSDLIVFLASDESSFATGAEFVVDGGETAGQPAN